MIISQDYTYDYNEDISSNELAVIYKFLNFYKNQNIIVADYFRQDFDMVPLEEEKIIFKLNEDIFKGMRFCKKIYHNGKPYVVELSFCRSGIADILDVSEFRIITKNKVHFINLKTNDVVKKNILFNIISTFSEEKVISPEQAYCKRMNTNKLLQDFITNHEWNKIYLGIKQVPSLANALFIIREGYETCTHYTADFGTILYQLISFRKNNEKDFNENDLNTLDKLILKLSKTELLKVQLHEQTGSTIITPTESILLESNVYNDRLHSSQQYTADNTELTVEKKILNKCIRKMKK